MRNDGGWSWRAVALGAAVGGMLLGSACAARESAVQVTFVDNGTAVVIPPGGTPAPPIDVATTAATTPATVATTPAPGPSAATTTSVAGPTSATTPVPPGPTAAPGPTPAPPPSAPPTTPRATTTRPQPTTTAADGDKGKAQGVAAALIAAWRAGDRAAAATVATPAVVVELFATPPAALEFDQCSGGVGNYLCTWESSGGDRYVQMWVAHEPGVPMIVRSLHLEG